MLNNAFSSFRTILSVAVLGATVSAGSASAAVVAYTDHDAFRAAYSDVHTDRFDSLPGGLNAGPYAGAGYTASAFDPIGYPADQNADALFGVDNGAGGHWLSSNFATSLLQFAFDANIGAVGGWFFGTDADGALVPGALTLTVRDASGSFDFLFDPALAGGLPRLCQRQRHSIAERGRASGHVAQLCHARRSGTGRGAGTRVRCPCWAWRHWRCWPAVAS